MADETSCEGSSSSQVTGESADSTIEINVKTLESQIYTFRVAKDMPVSALKEKIVNATGIPVEQQRLIFRGKVLKDDQLLSTYYLENGHTLHLVARQQVQAQPIPGTGSVHGARDNGNQENESTGARSRTRQVSHSVVLGTVNIAEPGEGMVADIGRLVGAVINSMGLGNVAPAPSAGTSNGPSSNEASQNVDAEGTQNFRPSAQYGSPMPTGFTSLNNPFQSTHVPHFLRHTGIPDSLTTLSEFVSRMELALQYGGSQSSPPTNGQDRSRPEVPYLNSRVLTPEMLAGVMESVRRLLSGNAAAALAHTAERLERDSSSTDPQVRGQIQSEAINLGVAMQHLGAMFLELGRTIMTLRMGQSPAEALVNAGPAVYISHAGPNPIMVQPSLQTSSLFGVPPLVGGVSGSFGAGEPSRNINIHIHTGASAAPGVTSVGARANLGESIQRDRQNEAHTRTSGNSSGDPVPIRTLAPRTVVAAIPARSAPEAGSHVLSVIYPVHGRAQQSVLTPRAFRPTASSETEPNIPIAVAQPSSESNSTPEFMAQLNAFTIPAGSESQGSHSTISSRAQTNTASLFSQSSSEANSIATLATQINEQLVSGLSGAPASMSSGVGTDAGKFQANSLAETEAGESSGSGKLNVSNTGISESSGQQIPSDEHLVIGGSSISKSVGDPANCQASDTLSSKPVIVSSGINSDSVSSGSEHPSQFSQSSKIDGPAPLGLGLGGLQPKRRVKPAKPVGNNDGSDVAQSTNPSQQSVVRGQQVLRSLVSQSSDRNTENSDSSSVLLPSIVSQIMNNLPLDGQGASGQVNNSNIISSALRSPALNSLLSGVAEQCTRDPGVMNTLNNVVQQVGSSEDIGSLLSGAGRGNGGIDFSRMFQQMMPVFSQALGIGSTLSTPVHNVQSEPSPQLHSTGGSYIVDDRNLQIDVQPIVERIEHHDSAGNVFRAMLESTGRLLGEGNNYGDLFEELGDNAELSNEFMEVLQSCIHQRLQTGSVPQERS